MKKIIAVILLSAGVLTAYAESDPEMKEIKIQRMARGFVEYNLKDASSAKYRNQKGFCGEVNAKNSYGAYTGFKRFIAADKGLVVIEDTGFTHDQFEELWAKLCK